MGRLRANYNASKNNRISIKKQNLGVGKLNLKSLDPRSIIGLQVWFDANDTSTLFDSDVGGNVVTSDNATIGRWEDKSGNNFHATQSTASFRPVLKTGIRNGRNVLRWDGVTSLRSMHTVNLADNWSNLTCFAVIQRFSNGEFSFGRVWERGNGQRQYLVGGGGLQVRITSNQANTNSFSFPNNTWYLGTFQWNGGLDVIADIFQKINRFRVTSGGSGSGTSVNSVVNTAFNIGNNAARTRAYDGDIAEILIYNNQLSEYEIINVETYLANKWGF